MEERNLMTMKDVAEYMRLTLQTIQRYVLKNEIPYHKVKTLVRFRFEEIEQWINKVGGKHRGIAECEKREELFTGTGERAANRQERNGEA